MAADDYLTISRDLSGQGLMTTPKVPASPPGPAPRRGLPRWAWVLIALLAAIALVAVAVAVFGRRGQTIVLPPAPAPSQSAISAMPTPEPSSLASSAAPVTLADGCLGGVLELDGAVLAAQRQAPLTPAGAASFTATLVRWAFAAPAPAYQAATAEQIMTANATGAAVRSLSSSKDLANSADALDFSAGKYYVESFTGDSAIVSYLAGGTGTLNGAPVDPGVVGGTVYLKAVNGTWHYQDRTAQRSIEDLQRMGVPYSGGC